MGKQGKSSFGTVPCFLYSVREAVHCLFRKKSQGFHIISILVWDNTDRKKKARGELGTRNCGVT